MSTVKVHPPVFLAVAHTWLRHASDPSLSMRVLVASLDTLGRDVNQSILPVLSRARPIVITDGARKSWDGNLAVELDSPAERAAFVALTQDASPLLFVAPAAWGWDFTSGWMSLGKLTWTNPAGIGRDPTRIASMPFVLVDPPTPGSSLDATIVAGSANVDDGSGLSSGSVHLGGG